MKLAVPKIRLTSAVGIYLADDRVAFCALEKGLLGTRQFRTLERPCSKQDWAVELHRLLEPLVTELGPATSVIIGLPASQAFFATLPTGQKQESAEALLAGHHCCSSIPPNELVADMLPVKVNGRSFAGVGAARRKELQILTDVVRKLGFRYVRIEPAPWALLRSCAPNPSGRMSLRLLMGGQHILATLVVGKHPLLWRTLDLREEDSAELILSLVRTFETYASQHLGVPSLDSIVMEGDADEGLVNALSGELGDRFSVHPGLGATPAAVAKGLALGGMNRDVAAPDLARSLAPPPHLWDLVPRGEISILCAVIVCLSLWLYARGSIVQNNAARAEEENRRNAIFKVSEDQLKDEKKRLSAQCSAVHTFLSNRIVWTEYLNQLSHRIPPGIKFTSLQGDYELATGQEKAEKKLKKGLILNFTTQVPRELSAPKEVDSLLENIRSAPVVMRDFPEVTLSTLRINKNLRRKRESEPDSATFTVMCMPKGKDKKPPPDKTPDAKGGGEKAVAKSD